MLGFNRYQECKYRDRFKPENIVISYSTKDPVDTINVTFQFENSEYKVSENYSRGSTESRTRIMSN